MPCAATDTESAAGKDGLALNVVERSLLRCSWAHRLRKTLSRASSALREHRPFDLHGCGIVVVERSLLRCSWGIGSGNIQPSKLGSTKTPHFDFTGYGVVVVARSCAALRQPNLTVDDGHGNPSQRIALAWAGHTHPIAELERRPVRGADQMTFLAFQELTWSPVQSPAGVRANVKPCTDVRALPIQQQRFGIPIDHRFDFGESAVLQMIECDQRRTV